jgi:hypothetical protein
MNQTGFFSKALKSSNQLLLFINIALLAIALAVALIGAKAFYQLVTGPQALEASAFTDLNAQPESFKRQHVTLKGTRIIDTGASEITVRKKRGVERGLSESAHYYALDMGNNQFVLVRGVVGAHTDPIVTGWIKAPGSSVDRNTLAQLDSGPAQGSMFKNIILDETDGGTFDWLVAIVVLLATLLAIWNIVKAIGRNKDQTKFPAIKTQKLGATDVPQFVASVDVDLASTQAVKGVRVGEKFALLQKSTLVELVNFDRLAWVYNQVTKKKIYGIIPAGSSHALVLYTNDEKRYEWAVGGKEETAHQALAKIADHVPWAVYGYTDDIQTMWKKDIRGFLNAIAQRKREIQEPATTVVAPVPADAPATGAPIFGQTS